MTKTIAEMRIERAVRRAWHVRCLRVEAMKDWTEEQTWEQISAVEKELLTLQIGAAIAAMRPISGEHEEALRRVIGMLNGTPRVLDTRTVRNIVNTYLAALGDAP